jgi:hypothetical protein
MRDQHIIFVKYFSGVDLIRFYILTLLTNLYEQNIIYCFFNLDDIPDRMYFKEREPVLQ